MSKQTAVTWFAFQLYEEMQMIGDGRIFDKLYNQAKQMEREQIEDAWDLSRRDIDYPSDGNQYYQQTYGKEESK